jgi:hypothetical protein
VVSIGLMPEPEGDDAAVDAALEQEHGRRVPQRVRRHPLAPEGGATWSRGGDVLRDEPLDGILAHASAAGTGEDRRVGIRRTLMQPGGEDPRDIAAQGRAAELAPLAVGADVGAGAERDVLAAERGQLGDAQPRLDGHEEERVVAPPDPGGGGWDIEEGLDLLLPEEFHDPAREALARDREDPLAQQGVGRLRERDVAEEGVERRTAGIAAARGVAALALEGIEELAEEGGVEVGEREAGGGTAEARGGEAQEQAEGVAVGGHRVRARPPLLQQAIGKEGLQERGKIGGAHGASSRGPVARSVASWRSSGTASTYQ